MLSNLSGMGTLTPLKPSTYIIRGKGAGHVWAQLSESGALKVVIETRDFGHFGEYGFAYSDLPLSLIPYPSDSEWFTIDEPGPLNMGRRDMKIDDHWWKTSNPD